MKIASHLMINPTFEMLELILLRGTKDQVTIYRGAVEIKKFFLER